jgi:hypothetical protein
MANKFQKSVLERLEAEENRRKAAEKADKPETESMPEENAVPQEEETAPERQPEAVEAKAAPSILERLAEASAPVAPGAIGAYISHDDQRVAKNKTFYLDVAVIDAVKRISQEQQITESRLVNNILRGVFGL